MQKMQEYETYTDRQGNKFVLIKNFWALNIMMKKKLGANWKKKSIKTYGVEQLFENKYDSKGKLIS